MVAAHCLYHDTQTEQTFPSDHAASLASADMFKALTLHCHPISTSININCSSHMDSNTNNPQPTSPQTSTAPQTKTHTHPRSPRKPSSPCTTQPSNPPPLLPSGLVTYATAAQQPAKSSTPTQIVISATSEHASSVSDNAIAHPAAELSVCRKIQAYICTCTRAQPTTPATMPARRPGGKFAPAVLWKKSPTPGRRLSAALTACVVQARGLRRLYRLIGLWTICSMRI
jgi:hypothetical protein